MSARPTGAGTTGTGPGHAGAFRVLRHRDFRLFWIAQTVSSLGTFMQVVGQSLLVLEISGGSAVALGAVSLAQALAFFGFSLLGGGLVDRFDERRVLLVTQSLLATVAVAMVALVAAGAATFPVVVALAFVSGVVASFDQPARASLLPHLVPRDELHRATGLNALAMTTAGTVGPALAGVTAEAFGLPVNFAANALGFLGVLGCVAVLRTPAVPATATVRQPLLRAVGEGLCVVARHPTLPWIVSAYGVLLLLGPSPSLLLPLFAAQVLEVGGAQLSVLFTMVGAGSLIASAIQAVLGSGRRMGVFVAAVAVWAAALVAFSLSSSVALCAAALLVLGAARNVVGTTAVTMMQLLAPDAVRGRVMSLNTLLANGVRPLGDFGVSAAMAGTSARFATGAAGVLVGLYALHLRTRFRHMEHLHGHIDLRPAGGPA